MTNSPPKEQPRIMDAFPASPLALHPNGRASDSTNHSPDSRIARRPDWQTGRMDGTVGTQGCAWGASVARTLRNPRRLQRGPNHYDDTPNRMLSALPLLFPSAVMISHFASITPGAHLAVQIARKHSGLARAAEAREHGRVPGIFLYFYCQISKTASH